MAERLPRINALTIEAFPARFHEGGGRGRGRGRVRARRESDHVITFDESGRFKLERGPTLNFHNALRWTLAPDRIVLAHCRHDAGDGTRLAELRALPTRSTDADLASAAPHLCGEDRYTATLRLVDNGFDLVWRIVGTRKNEILAHRYRVAAAWCGTLHR